MPSLNQVTTKCGTWQNYNYCITIIIYQIKYKVSDKQFNLKIRDIWVTEPANHEVHEGK